MTKLTVGEKGISVLGEKALEKYGDMEFTEKIPALFPVPLPRRMSNDEIGKELKPSTVELGEIYKLLDILPTQIKALFYVPDKGGSVRPVLIFHDGAGWNVVSPNDDEVPTWGRGDTLYSKTPL